MSAIDTRLLVDAPEGVSFTYELASVADRAKAYALDLLIRAVVLAVAALIVLIAMWPLQFAGVGLLLIVGFALEWGYYVLFEQLWNGQSPGKRVFQLRVVRVGGQPIGWWESVLRNLLRAADGLPPLSVVGSYLAGSLTCSLTERFQRLGDLAAGTIVIRERSGPLRSAPPATPSAASAQLRGVALNARQRRLIASFAMRQRALPPARREQLARVVAEPLARQLGLDLPQSALGATEMLLALHAVADGSASGAAPSPFPPQKLGREPRAPDTGSPNASKGLPITAVRRREWSELERLLDRFGPAGRGAPAGPSELSRFSALYRRVCADLARARAHSVSEDLIDYLNDLAARSYHVLYARRRSASGRLRHFFSVQLPLTVRRNAPYVATGLALFFLPLLAVVLLARFDDQLLFQLVPEQALRAFEQMYSAGHASGRGEDVDMAMAGFYVRNNVGIAFQCFASGIFFGIGSIFFLLFNGVLIGAVIGFVGTSSVGPNLLAFIVAHGPFELTAIALSGAAGLRLGLGPIAAGSSPRGRALRTAALDGVQLVALATLLLLAAAAIEGFVSPSSLPVAVKLSVAAVSVVLLVAYLMVLPWVRGRAAASKPSSVVASRRAKTAGTATGAGR